MGRPSSDGSRWQSATRSRGTPADSHDVQHGMAVACPTGRGARTARAPVAELGPAGRLEHRAPPPAASGSDVPISPMTPARTPGVADAHGQVAHQLVGQRLHRRVAHPRRVRARDVVAAAHHDLHPRPLAQRPQPRRVPADVVERQVHDRPAAGVPNRASSAAARSSATSSTRLSRTANGFARTCRHGVRARPVSPAIRAASASAGSSNQTERSISRCSWTLVGQGRPRRSAPSRSGPPMLARLSRRLHARLHRHGLLADGRQDPVAQRQELGGLLEAPGCAAVAAG